MSGSHGRATTQNFPEFTQNLENCIRKLKIPHTGDKASLDRCGQQHRYHSRAVQEYPKTRIFFTNGKIIQNIKTQKHLEICQNQRYALRPEVSNPSGSVVSNMFCQANSAKKKIIFFVLRFQTTSKEKCSNLRPLLTITITFPQGFQISKNIGHPTLGSGGKKTFKQYLKILT